jgi:hypothetical protein
MQKFPLCYEIFSRSGKSRQLNDYEDRQHAEQLNQDVIRAALRFGTNSIVCSLRYLYSPNQQSKIRTFILINCTSKLYQPELIDRIKDYFDRGTISNNFHFLLQEDTNYFQNLDWVNCIGGIVKFEELVTPNHDYVAHEFDVNPNNDFMSVLGVISHAKQDLILEITIKTCSKSLLLKETQHIGAIEEVLAGLRLAASKDSSSFRVQQSLKTYEKYKNNYENSDFFKYNIKVLSTNIRDAQIVLDTLVDCLTLQDRSVKQGRIFYLNNLEKEFYNSKKSTIDIDISELPLWEGWSNKHGDTFIINPNSSSKTKGFLDFADGSLSLPPKNSQINTRSLERKNKLTSNSHLSPKPALNHSSYQLKDLKQLHKLVTAKEASIFFRIAALNSLIPTSDYNNLFNKYKNLITGDRYIVGIDDKGKVITSDWSIIPHRLIAGVPGSGKSNFLTWIIFQFLYANPDGKIYIADFKGTDFDFLIRYFGDNVDVVKTVEECQIQLERIEADQYIYRRELINKYGVQNIKQLQHEKIDIPRTLWIVDEAADITDAPHKIKESIEKSLKKIARQGRAFGIHLIYSTQRPTSEVINRQVTDQCEEKIIFRVSIDASQRIILCDDAGKISSENTGRAILQQGSNDRTAVNTPSIQVPIGSQIRLEDTLWININTVHRGKL